MSDPMSPPPPGPEGGEPTSTPPVSDTAAISSSPTNDEKTWGTIAHLSGLAGLIGIPFANVVAPLIVWLIKKDQMPFVDDQGKEALNFQLTAAIVVWVIAAVSWIPPIFCVTIPLLFIIGIGVIILTIIGGLKANNGERYRYPLTIRLIK